MTLRSLRTALRSGRFTLSVDAGEIEARTPCQRKRFMEAVTAARLYLDGDATTAEIGRALGVSGERAAQMVRLGVSCLRRAGWLREIPGSPAPRQSRSGSGRGRG